MKGIENRSSRSRRESRIGARTIAQCRCVLEEVVAEGRVELPTKGL
jgi:hypothetical protein